jgi:hypothetical protein
MTSTTVRLACFGALLSVAVAAFPATARAQQPFDPSAWTISGAEWRVEPYRGRSALFLREGAAWLRGSRFRNGTIEFDIAFSEVSGFPGIAFRAATHADYELFYLRENLSGQPHATQYTPVLHGLYAWQIYAGPKWEATARWTYDRWMHVKVDVSGTRAELYVDGDRVQVVPRLRGPEGEGEVGIVADPGAARFTNFVVRPADAPVLTGTPPAVNDSTPPSIVRTWRVSAPFAESLLNGGADLTALPGPAAWQTLAIEERGIANLARLAGASKDRNTVVAAVTITSDRARTVPVRFGFSDRVRVYLNGKMLYAGNDGFGTHDPDFLGIVGLFDELTLPLERGANELWFAVSETFGGWAITADLPDRDGITVGPRLRGNGETNHRESGDSRVKHNRTLPTRLTLWLSALFGPVLLSAPLAVEPGGRYAGQLLHLADQVRLIRETVGGGKRGPRRVPGKIRGAQQRVEALDARKVAWRDSGLTHHQAS